MHVEIRCSTEDFNKLELSWKALVEQSVVSTPFQTIEFQNEWWANFGNGELRLICVYDTDNLVGLASMYIDQKNVLRWVGGEDIADYHDVIASEENVKVVRKLVFDWLSGSQADDWHNADLVNIPSWSGTVSHWTELALAQDWKADSRIETVCPQLALPDNFETYLGALGGKQRREIRRKLRRADAEGASAVFITDPSDQYLEIQEFIKLMESSGREKAEFLNSGMREGFVNILKVMQDCGLLRLCFLKLEDHNLASYAYFSLDDTLYLYNSGYDIGQYSALSPGWVLLAKLFDYAIKNGHKRFDFMRGDEDYKYRFGGEDVSLMRLQINR